MLYSDLCGLGCGYGWVRAGINTDVNVLSLTACSTDCTFCGGYGDPALMQPACQ